MGLFQGVIHRHEGSTHAAIGRRESPYFVFHRTARGAENQADLPIAQDAVLGLQAKTGRTPYWNDPVRGKIENGVVISLRR